MATSIGLLQMRGRSNGAQLLLGQLRSTQRRRLYVENNCTRGGYGLALLRARRSSSSAGNTDSGDIRVHFSCNVPGVGNAVVGTTAFRGTSRLLNIRGLSSTARPSRDNSGQEGADTMAGSRQDLSFKDSRYDTALECYPWEKEQHHKADLDDGDLVSGGF